jgi:hypothetical protein
MQTDMQEGRRVGEEPAAAGRGAKGFGLPRRGFLSSQAWLGRGVVMSPLLSKF